MGARLATVAATVVAALTAVLLGAPAAGAALSLAPVGDFSQPIFVTAPPGDPHRLFVVEKRGTIQLVRDGKVGPQPFLDIHDAVLNSNERGLLSMAIAPDYATSGLFYVYYTTPRSGDPGGGVEIVEEFKRSAADPDVADPASGRVLLRIDHPTYSNHNGGQLQFGPDGLLYIGTGDGGSSNDPPNNAQNTHALLGKLLRIGPRRSAGAAYTIPAGNPYANGVAGAPEVFAYGLRNPWRFSFDRATGDLVIGDVGQSQLEEIDVAKRGTGAGADYGWRCIEGTLPNADASRRCTPSGSYVPPVFTYGHDRGCAIVGGYVVRDRDLPSLAGRYVYGDNCNKDIRSLSLSNPGASDASTGLTVDGLYSFGEDSCGHLYTASGGGQVSRVAGDVFTPCPEGGSGGNGGGPGGPDGGGTGDTRAPGLSVDRRHVQRLGRKRSLYVAVRCDEICGVQVSGRLSVPGAAGVKKLAVVSRTLARGVRVKLRLKVSRKAAKAARRSLKRGHRVKARIRVVARDPAGNQTVKTRTVRVRR